MYQGHDDTSVDKLNPLGPGFVKIQSTIDNGTQRDAQGNLSPYRDTLNNSADYIGQFNALGDWSQANAAGNWSALELVEAANALHIRNSANSARTVENLSILLAAGDYTIAASGALTPGGNSLGLTNLDGQLTFSYAAVPLPGAALLFGSALLGGLRLTRRMTAI